MAAKTHSCTSLQGTARSSKEQCCPEMYRRMRLEEEEASGSQWLLTGGYKPRYLASVWHDSVEPFLLQTFLLESDWAWAGIHVFAYLLFLHCLASLLLTGFSWEAPPQQILHTRVPISSSVSRGPNLRNLPKSTSIAVSGIGEIFVLFLF